jgi:hypothetical protein
VDGGEGGISERDTHAPPGLAKASRRFPTLRVAGFKGTVSRFAGNGVASAAANGDRETAPQQERNGDGVAGKG